MPFHVRNTACEELERLLCDRHNDFLLDKKVVKAAVSDAKAVVARN
jgi:hypothetical protein